MGLIFSPFNVTSAGHVPFGIPQYIHAFFMDLPVSSFADSERCQFGIAHDGLATFVTEIVRIFHNGYFDFKGAFRTVFDS